MKFDKNQDPALLPPGAGLGFGQRVFAKTIVGPILSKIIPLSRAKYDYEAHTKNLILVASEMSVEQRKMRFLITPIGGLEDSSRYWSINGVLEHLLIVSRGIEQAILSLGRGVVPSGSSDPARVKPKDQHRDYLEEFQAYAPTLLEGIDEAVAKVDIDLNSKATFVHPWFGNLNARQWYWLLSRHQGIHATQARLISRGLKT